MRVIIVCLIFFIVGYHIGNKGATVNKSMESSLDTVIEKKQLFEETTYQVSNNLSTDSLLTKQAKFDQ